MNAEPGNQPAPSKDSNATTAPPPSPSLPDLNAETYPFALVQKLLDQAAYFNLRSMPDPDCSPVEVQDEKGSGGVTGFRISEMLHRFQVVMPQPTVEDGLLAANRLGEFMGRFNHRWMIIPDDFRALPDLEPPPTALDANRSQRFVMLDGLCLFDGGQDGFRGFGAGRTYPVARNGQRHLLAAAVGNILEGFGKFKGHEGTYTYCGSLSPQQGFSGNLLCRAMDPSRDLLPHSSLPALEKWEDPASDFTYIVMRGQKKDDSQKTTYNIGPNGEVQGLIVEQQLRLVHIDGAIAPREGLCSVMNIGPVIGTMTAKILFNLLHPGAPGTALAPIAFQSINEYTFCDPAGRVIGSIVADLSEGRTFNMTLTGAPGQAALRFGGFGRIVDGRGRFEGIEGLTIDNSVVGIAPHALSTLYVLRVHDPEGKYRDALPETQ